MSKFSVSPSLNNDLHSKKNLLYIASAIYQAHLQCKGNPEAWLKSNWQWYKARLYECMCFTKRNGSLHFLRQFRADILVPMEVEIIDLINRKCFEVFDLT